MKNEFKRLFEYYRWISKDALPFVGYIFVIILLDAISAVSGVAIAIISKNLIDFSVKGLMDKTIVYAALFAGIILANLGIRALSSIISTKTLERLSNSIRQRLFAKIAWSEWLPVTKYHSGDILTRLTSDIGTVASGVVNTLPSIISLGVQLVAAFVTLLYYEPTLAILAFILGPFTVLFSRIWGKKLKRLHIKVQESESSYRSFLQEAIANILIVKAFRMEHQSNRKINQLHQERMKWVMQRNKTSVVAGTTLGLGYWSGYFMAFCYGALKLSSGATTFGTLTAFLQLVGQVQGPFMGLASTLPQVIAVIGSTERLIELEALPVEDNSGEVQLNLPVGISLSGVSYSYPNSKPVLEKVSANIYPGEIVALIGQSGEGKTTLIRMLLALLKPDIGEVSFVDRHRRYTASASTRDWISYVPQGNTLFSGTIEENIKSGYAEASAQEVEAAIQAACARDFISELPEGIHTVIGEHGLGVSEGQAQRIAIARALLRKTPVLILDEATSALDIDSELHILNSINELNPPRTCIVITHRPSALGICSRILKIKDSKLVEEGMRDKSEEGYASA